MKSPIAFPEFVAMEELDQLEILLTEGILQAQSKTSKERSFLYELSGFYVKVMYSEPGEIFKSISCYEGSAEAFSEFQQPSGVADPACRVNALYDK